MPSRPPVHRAPGQGDRQQQRHTYDQHRDQQDWRRWYKTARWQAIRAAQLRQEPLCRMCKATGRLTPANTCDHEERHDGDLVRFWTGPFQSLCTPCHSSDKQRQETGGPSKSTGHGA